MGGCESDCANMIAQTFCFSQRRSLSNLMSKRTFIFNDSSTLCVYPKQSSSGFPGISSPCLARREDKAMRLPDGSRGPRYSTPPRVHRDEASLQGSGYAEIESERSLGNSKGDEVSMHRVFHQGRHAPRKPMVLRRHIMDRLWRRATTLLAGIEESDTLSIQELQEYCDELETICDQRSTVRAKLQFN